MNNQIKELFGSWVQAIGTFIAAVGATPSPILTNQQLNNLSLIGNVLQAVGNALIADTIEQFNLEKSAMNYRRLAIQPWSVEWFCP